MAGTKTVAGPRRWGVGTSRAVRELAVAAHPVRQTALARRLGVSQPRVSQILALLTAEGVAAERLGTPGTRLALARLYAAHHRPLAAGEQLWYGLDDQQMQAAAVLRTARRAEVPVVFSADLAPELIVPWRAPTLTVVYAGAPLDLDPDGFVVAAGRGEASLVVRVVTDESLLEAWPWPRTELPLAHPLQQAWDLFDLGGSDRAEAAELLVARLPSTEGAGEGDRTLS